jgi:uncharacterized membrane protein
MKITPKRSIWFFILILTTASVSATDYTFEVSENGETNVFVSIGENETVHILLPPDVGSPHMKGGEFSITEDGIEATAEEEALVTYASSFHTRKEEGIWYFESSVNADDATLVLPQDVQIVQSKPRALITKGEKLKLKWSNISNNITVSYVRILESPLAEETRPDMNVAAIVLAVLFLAAISLAYFFRKKFFRIMKQDIDVSDGQMNVMRAANANEAAVLKILLKNNGHIKRNKLEKESSMPKSSLASTLKNLEKKNIVEIDRSFHVHYITLTKWFKEL